MVVLPGTFISTLFAVPLFDWDAPSWSGVAKPRFWFYWAITVPLTLSTLLIWMIWEKAFNRRSEELERLAREEVDNQKEGKENDDGGKGVTIHRRGSTDLTENERGVRPSSFVSSGRGSSISRSLDTRRSGRRSVEYQQGVELADREGRKQDQTMNVERGEAREGMGRDNKNVVVETWSDGLDTINRPPVRRYTTPVRRGSRIGELV